MLAGAPAKEHADAETLVRDGHRSTTCLLVTREFRPLWEGQSRHGTVYRSVGAGSQIPWAFAVNLLTAVPAGRASQVFSEHFVTNARFYRLFLWE
jgi:hypothetical protein